MMRGDKLKTVVYADILIFINTIVNYFLIKACALITGCSCKAFNIFLSSFIGGLFSLIIYVDKIHPLLNFLIKIFFMAVMIFTAFKIKSLKSFLKIFFSFFLTNIIFGGIMLAINIFLLPESSLYNNGVVYFNTDIFSLTITSALCYAILRVINIFSKNKIPHKSVYSLKITYKDKTVEGKALYDSGNTLCDCFSGRPVIIAEKSFINKIINTEKLEEAEKFRIIPYSTINGNGLLSAFMADKIEIYISDKVIKTENIFIAVTDKKIISTDYTALFGTPFYDLIYKSI